LIGGARIAHFPLEHPGGSMGYRLDWPDRSLAYITDTTASASADYVERIRGVDLLVHECNFNDEQAEWARETGHSFASAVAEVATSAKVKRLVLVHFDSLADTEDPVSIARLRENFSSAELGADNVQIDF
jgi:ribonuclease Z